MSFLQKIKNAIIPARTVSIGAIADAAVKSAHVPAAIGFPPGFELNAEFVAALEAIKSGVPLVFVTGQAGTGKSTLIDIVQRTFAGKNVVVVVPTGIAALNVGGQTIHSFFKLPPKPLDASDVKTVQDRTLYERMDLLIIDEISMVRPDVMDAVDLFLRQNRRTPHMPFGGVQLLLVGDLFQLPPVVSHEEDAFFIAREYTSRFFFSAKALSTLQMAVVELKKIYRQSDPSYIALLGNIRRGVNTRASVEQLNVV